ncbi:MAG: YCF48-related protein [Acidobacteriota bacterium]
MRRTAWLAAFVVAAWIGYGPSDLVFAQQQQKGPGFGKQKQKQPPSKQQKSAKAFGAIHSDPDTSGLEWKLSYFYDDDREVLHFADIAFPSRERGIAVGSIVDETRGGNGKPVAVITTNGGKTWTKTDLDDHPVSLFFLNESLGWMVGARGIWKTEESGRSWKRIRRHSELAIRQVWFLDPDHGFAVGEEQTVLETRNGGKDWTPVPAARQASADKNISVYTQIAFADGERGLIAGAGIPQLPKNARLVRQPPRLTLELETRDGGKKWAGSAAALSGQIADLTLIGSDGLAVFAFPSSYQWPSEVYRLDLNTGKSGVTFHQDNRRVTGSILFPGQRGFLAGYDLRVRAQTEAVPGRIRILRSTDLQRWLEMEVDYRAVGSRVVLAGPDADHVWAATDSGMVLQMGPKE